MQKGKVVLIVGLLMCMLFKSYAQETYSYTNPQRKYHEALELFNAEKYGSALKLFDELKQEILDKNSYMFIDAYYYSALSSSFLYNRDAEYKIKQFITSYPENSKVNLALFYLGNSLYSQQNYSEALFSYEKIDQAEIPGNLLDEYHFKLAYCYFLDSNFAAAKDIFIQVKETSSAYATPATYYYAHILYIEKDYTVALLNFEKLKEDKNFGQIVPFYITHVYYLQGKYTELLSYAPDVLQKASPKRETEISRMIGEAYYYKAQYKDAFEYLKPSIDKSAMPSSQDLYILGYCCYNLKKYSLAKEYFIKLNTSKDSLAQNAMYHLADCYLKDNEKQEACAAFLEAYNLDFDSKIKESALYNYAKLSLEIPNNSFNEAIKAFQKYQENYPNSEHKNEINEVMANLYFSVRNYKDALALIEGISPRTTTVNKAYQRISLNRGIELFNEDKLDEAILLFENVIKNDYNDTLVNSAYYLKSEALFRLNNYEAAEDNLKKYFVLATEQSMYYTNACYTMGYSCLKQRNYNKAVDYFKRYENAEKAKKDNVLADVYNRLGDCYFVTKKFKIAMEEYDKNIALSIFDSDYALYQKAVCAGALGKHEDKIKLLTVLAQQYSSSIYLPSVYYELANTYLILESNDMALKNYNHLVTQYPNSNYVRASALKIGMVEYMQGHDKEALTSLEKVVQNYPNTSEAYDALVTIKNIYVSQNSVDEYFSYVKSIPQAQVSSTEKDSLIYSAAESRYLDSDCESAVKGFAEYLKKCPDGIFSLNANYYKADCHYRQGKYEQALPNYEYIIAQPKSNYTEKSLLNASSISFNFKEYEKAYEYYLLLEKNTEVKTNKIIAEQGIMRCLYRMQNYSATVQIAEQFLKTEKISEEAIDEANNIMARSYYTMNDTINARLKFKQLVKSKNGEYAAEANYRLAEMLYREHRFEEAEKAIIGISANPTSDYWLAKSFILWAGIYEYKGNLFQAKQTLKSIINNYEGEELVREAQERLNSIQLLEEKNKAEQEKLANEQKEDVEIIHIEEIPADNTSTNEELITE